MMAGWFWIAPTSLLPCCVRLYHMMLGLFGCDLRLIDRSVFGSVGLNIFHSRSRRHQIFGLMDLLR